MVRKTFTTLLLALVAAFTLAPIADAAPRKATHHRTRHSSRVSSGAASSKTKHRATRRSSRHGVTKKSGRTHKTTTKPR